MTLKGKIELIYKISRDVLRIGKLVPGIAYRLDGYFNDEELEIVTAHLDRASKEMYDQVFKLRKHLEENNEKSPLAQ